MKTLLITTGGTIACARTGDGLKPGHSGGELLPPEKAENVEIKDLFALDSTDITPAHWRRLYEAVSAAVSSGKYGGIVIFHGTDTLEYTAALLRHTVKTDIPVILTGSMLPMEAEGSDGARNARDALCCAEAPELAGVYVVFAGRIIAGDEAIKRFSAEADAFRSFSGSDCGRVENGRAVLARRPAPARIFPFPEKDARIAVVKLTPFSDTGDLDLKNCGGAVIESFGAGGLPAGLLEAAEKLAAEIPVVMTTACTGGARLDEYEVGRRALKAGIIGGGMTTACAAVLLYLGSGGVFCDDKGI